MRFWRTQMVAASLLLTYAASSAQSTIRLYPGVAPGSEGWNLPERNVQPQQIVPEFKVSGSWLTNVSVPTLTVFRPDPGKANGTAVIVCPGGAFHFLAMEQEGMPIARWLRDRGITTFLLKYRVLQTTSEHMKRQFTESGHLSAELAAFYPVAMGDARQALTYVRAHASEFGVAPTKIGMIGFSAGAMLVVSTALASPAGSAPDFIAALYTNVEAFMRPLRVPTSAPPAFFAMATDDQLGFAAASTEVYNAWIAAGRSAELHAYAKGGHGFGMSKQGLPVDTWVERFEDWLRFQGLLKAPE